MKVTAIVASPRKGGNCDVLTDEAIKGAKENGADVTKYFLQDLEIEGCRACGHCGDGIDCIIEDDMATILADMLDSDAIIFSTPIYFGLMSSQGKQVIDRFYSVFTNPQKEFSGKALTILTSGAPPEALPGEDFVVGVFDTLGFETTALKAGGILPPGAAAENDDFMKTAYDFGNSL